MEPLVHIEPADDDPAPGGDGGGAGSRVLGALAGVAVVGLVALGASVIAGDERAAPVGTRPPNRAPFAPIPEVDARQRLPDPARAARCYELRPSAHHLREVFEAVGGFDGLVLATAEGPFDLVTFDAADPDELLATRRSGYGPAENQDVNERWSFADGTIRQTIWDAGTPHDFVHHNTDGTMTMWVHDGASRGLAPRTAVVIDRSGAEISRTAPMHADRFAIDDGTVFALTGDPDWYAPRDEGYRQLVADDGERQLQLAPAGELAWIEVPVPGVLVAYGVDGGETLVWDTRTLEPVPDHPLAGRPYQRTAVAGDGRTAVGVTHSGELEPVDLRTGLVGPRFGDVDVVEVDRPIVLGDAGRVAITVERTGRVSVWYVGDGEPIASYAAGSGVPRWLPTSRSAARLASALAPDASRVALRIDARPGVGVSWRLIDADVDSWLARAAALSDEPVAAC